MLVAQRLQAALEATTLDAQSAPLASALVTDVEQLQRRLLGATRPVQATLALPDGSRQLVIMKWRAATSRLAAWPKGHSRRATLVNEVATRRVALLMGGEYAALVPPVALRPDAPATAVGPHTAMVWRPGETRSPLRDVMLMAPAAWRAAALLDFVTGQQDRHGGNYLWDSATSTLTLIDHGLAFAVWAPPTQSMIYRSRLRADSRARSLQTDEVLALERLLNELDRDALGGMLTRRALGALRRRAQAAHDRRTLPRGFRTH